jgi:hypothetical protein
VKPAISFDWPDELFKQPAAILLIGAPHTLSRGQEGQSASHKHTNVMDVNQAERKEREEDARRVLGQNTHKQQQHQLQEQEDGEQRTGLGNGAERVDMGFPLFYEVQRLLLLHQEKCVTLFTSAPTILVIEVTVCSVGQHALCLMRGWMRENELRGQ